jgi:hypothetical protein
LILRIAKALRIRGLRKGVIGGNRRWLTIWAAVAMGQTLHRLLKPKPTIERFRLKPGETVVITDLGMPEEEAPSL